MAPNLSTVSRAARMLGIPERTIYTWVKSNRTRAYHVASSVTLVDMDHLVELNNQKRKRGSRVLLPRRTKPIDYRMLEDAAAEWDVAASFHWCVPGREELGAAYAVMAFFAWLEVLGEQRDAGAQNVLTGDAQCARGADTTQDGEHAHERAAEREEAAQAQDAGGAAAEGE
jgi:hypothetical protein